MTSGASPPPTLWSQRGAGRDASELFAKYHPRYVRDTLLEYEVGPLLRDGEEAAVALGEDEFAEGVLSQEVTVRPYNHDCWWVTVRVPDVTHQLGPLCLGDHVLLCIQVGADHKER